MNGRMSSTWDVCVVGGGPAGLAAAIALRLRGLQVVVADGLRPPIDKACGEGLMPDALRMQRLGIEIPAELCRKFWVRFVDNEREVDGDFSAGTVGCSPNGPARKNGGTRGSLWCELSLGLVNFRSKQGRRRHGGRNNSRALGRRR
jgi:hypothetical protein